MGKFWFIASGEMWENAVKESLTLDDGTKIIEVEYDPPHNIYKILAENDDTGAEDGQEIPYVIPVYSMDNNGNSRLIAWHEPSND